jgi:hypothetical protein
MVTLQLALHCNANDPRGAVIRGDADEATVVAAVAAAFRLDMGNAEYGKRGQGWWHYNAQ